MSREVTRYGSRFVKSSATQAWGPGWLFDETPAPAEPEPVPDHPVDVTEMIEPAPLPWREVLAGWPDAWREQWGRRANDLEDAGHAWRDAERIAFEEMTTP